MSIQENLELVEAGTETFNAQDWVFKIEGGKVSEEHDYRGNLPFLSQLGLAPE